MENAHVTAVIITHDPPRGMRKRLDATLGQVAHIIIVDNNSAKKPEAHDDKIDIIRNDENKGLAAALNQGIHHALSQNADWILLLDHDSEPEPGMVARMLAAYDAHPHKERIGLIAPNIKDENTAAETRYLVPSGKFWFRRSALDTPYNDKILSVITSGSLIKPSVFPETGLMPEHFFIDYIDYAFCLRLKKCGYDILLVKDAVLNHKLGDKKEHGIAGAKIIASHHSAARRYTIFRNRIWLWKRYKAIFPGFVAHDVLAAGFDMLRIACCEKEKWGKCKAIMMGIRDGLRQEPG